MNKQVKQFEKDLKKLINDNRIKLSFGVYADKDNYGYLMGVYFESGKIDFLGAFKIPCNDSFDYSYFKPCLDYIRSIHPERKNEKVLVRVKIDTKKKARFKVTDQSDLEFFNASTYTNISNDLLDLINESAHGRDNLVYKFYDATYDRFIATYDYSYTQDMVI